jgi:hypothetical protein
MRQADMATVAREEATAVAMATEMAVALGHPAVQ